MHTLDAVLSKSEHDPMLVLSLTDVKVHEAMAAYASPAIQQTITGKKCNLVLRAYCMCCIVYIVPKTITDLG